MLRHRATTLITLSLACLPGCAAHAPAPPPVAAAPPHCIVPTATARSFSVNTPVALIVANPRGKAILQRDVPDLLTNRSYQMFCDMSLTQLATLSNGQLTTAKLNQVQSDLAQLDPP